MVIRFLLAMAANLAIIYEFSNKTYSFSHFETFFSHYGTVVFQDSCNFTIENK